MGPTTADTAGLHQRRQQQLHLVRLAGVVQRDHIAFARDAIDGERSCLPRRGGWSWYTGSSGWMYRLIVESLLGVTRGAHELTLAPRMPAEWNEFTLTYRHASSSYVIRVARAESGQPATLTVDGVTREGNVIALDDTGQTHQVQLLLPALM